MSQLRNGRPEVNMLSQKQQSPSEVLIKSIAIGCTNLVPETSRDEELLVQTEKDFSKHDE